MWSVTLCTSVMKSWAYVGFLTLKLNLLEKIVNKSNFSKAYQKSDRKQSFS